MDEKKNVQGKPEETKQELTKEKFINFGALKHNRELNKQQKAAEKAADTSPKTKRSIWEKIGIGSSYVAVGAAAAGAAVAVMRHLNGADEGQIDDLVAAARIPGATDTTDIHQMISDAMEAVDPSAEVVNF